MGPPPAAGEEKIGKYNINVNEWYSMEAKQSQFNQHNMMELYYYGK